MKSIISLITDMSKYHNVGVVKHGLEYIRCYVQKHLAPLAICSNPSLVCVKPLGEPTFVIFAYSVNDILSICQITVKWKPSHYADVNIGSGNGFVTSVAPFTNMD